MQPDQEWWGVAEVLVGPDDDVGANFIHTPRG